MQKKLLIIKTGRSFPAIVRECGDFDDWVVAGMQPLSECVKVLEAYKNPPLPSHDTICGVVVTGSHAMVSDRELWSERIARWIPGAIAGGIPLLGICYGHQLLAHAMGGTIGYHPEGREIGTVRIGLHVEAAQDPLLGCLPAEFAAHVIHSQSVLKQPPGAARLASNAFEANHAIRLGRAAWGLQFHPEFSAHVMRAYIDELSEVLEQEGLNPELLRQQVAETPESSALLQRFAEIVRHHRRFE